MHILANTLLFSDACYMDIYFPAEFPKQNKWRLIFSPSLSWLVYIRHFPSINCPPSKAKWLAYCSLIPPRPLPMDHKSRANEDTERSGYGDKGGTHMGIKRGYGYKTTFYGRLVVCMVK